MFKKIEYKNLPIDNLTSDICSIAIIIPHQNNIENLKKLLNLIQKKTNNRLDPKNVKIYFCSFWAIWTIFPNSHQHMPALKIFPPY